MHSILRLKLYELDRCRAERNRQTSEFVRTGIRFGCGGVGDHGADRQLIWEANGGRLAPAKCYRCVCGRHGN